MYGEEEKRLLTIGSSWDGRSRTTGKNGKMGQVLWTVWNTIGDCNSQFGWVITRLRTHVHLMTSHLACLAWTCRSHDIDDTQGF